MPWSLPTDVLDQLRTQELGDTWLEFWRLEIDVTPTWTPTLCLVAHEAALTFNGETYYPYPIERGAIEADAEGGASRTSLSISNVDRMMAAQLERGAGFLDMSVQWSMGLLSHLATPAAFITIPWTVTGSGLTAERAVLSLEARPTTDVDLPPEIYNRIRCIHAFRQGGCTYEPDPTLGANFQSCGKRLADCIERGNDQVARGLPRTLPESFGAFPGIQRRVRGSL